MGKHTIRQSSLPKPPTPVTPLHGVLTPKKFFVVETTCLKHNIPYPDTDVWKLLYTYNEDARTLADTSDQPWPTVFLNAGYTLVDAFSSNKAPKP